MPRDLVPAIWVGPFPATLPDGRRLEHGDEALISEDQAQSGHWRPKPKPGRTTSAPQITEPAEDEVNT